jgi:hypothetical protein
MTVHQSEATMRGLVLLESLVGGQLPRPLPAVVVCEYPHLLSGELPVRIVELAVAPDRVPTVAMRLAQALLPQRFYAHLLDAETMYVAFPNCVTVIHRADPATAANARRVGAQFDIPGRQMRFEEMFTNDHPDSPGTGAA